MEFLFRSSVLGMMGVAGLGTMLIPFLAHAQGVHNAAEVEEKVRAAFSDVPVMIEIARCESKFRQYTDGGNPLRGGYGNGMVGVFQFYESVHAEGALALGFDLTTLEGNIGYARHVYGQSGTDPWNSSFYCWKGAEETTAFSSPSSPSVPAQSELSATLRFGQTHAEVLLLQKILNSAGFAVAHSGPGSSGSETTFFGSLTREAVQKFQCAQGIACSGDESSTGYGLVGPNTRMALLSYGGSGSAVFSSGNSKPAENTALEKKPEEGVAGGGDERAELQARIAELLKLVEELKAKLARL